MGDALDEARARSFVGRDEELHVLDRVIRRRSSVHVHGPPGVGKTELLHAAESIARRSGVRTLCLRPEDVQQLRGSTRWRGPEVILIDDLNDDGEISRWVVGRLAPTLQGMAAVITAGRVPSPLAEHSVELAPLQVVCTLDQEAFAREVKRALRCADRPDLLHASPLVGCRMVLDGECTEGANAPAERLQRLLRSACEAVRDEQGDLRGWEVLERTYLQPAVKQLVAADELGLSFATYRRALASATAQVIERLWSGEQEARGASAGSTRGGAGR